MGCGVWGMGFGVWGLGCKARLRVWGLGFRERIRASQQGRTVPDCLIAYGESLISIKPRWPAWP